MGAFSFSIEKKYGNTLARAGILTTPHGVIKTPAFIVVGTKASVKALSPEQVTATGAQCALANTYHLYLEPGEKIVEKAGGLHSFMNWQAPTMTDSGGFQAFSLGAAFGFAENKFERKEITTKERKGEKLATVDEDGVTFRSHIDGSKHRFTPETSIAIQHAIGADIMFAFDECTSFEASYEYQKEALDRTHRWAKRSLAAHVKNGKEQQQGLFGVIQGGKYKDLREESARIITALTCADSAGKKHSFDGFGIGGSFSKEHLDQILHVVNALLPEEKPRHLLGIGEPVDLFTGVEQGIDTFDCVAPTRIARTGMLYTKEGRISIIKAIYKEDFLPIDEGCTCYTCTHYTRSYLSHLFRANEMFGCTLASIHNIHFIVTLVDQIRQSLLDDTFLEYKRDFLKRYYNT